MENPASMVETVPVGYRFHPTDAELVGHYLKHKLLGNDSGVHNIIAEVDVCKFEPWDLPAFSKVKSDDPEWFFFSPLDLKCTKSIRYNRKTKTGYWKITGKDRNIKNRATNKVIGTKKTLVFYKSCGRRRDKTNWVIHEYHAVTFHDDKSGFVLCRLIKKPEKKAEGGADELILDEGEPSSHIASDYENLATADRSIKVYASPEVNLESLFPAPPQAGEYEFLSPQQFPVVTEEASYFRGSSFPNTFSGDEDSIMEFQFETTEEEGNIDSFLNSILANEDVFIGEEIAPAFVDDSTASQSLSKVYYESRETTELLSALHENILHTIPLVWNEHTDSWENPALSMVESSQDAVYADPPPVSSENESNMEENDNTFDDNAIANASFSVFLIQSVCSPPPQARSPSPPGTHISISSQAVSQQEALMETHILESNIEQGEAQGTSSRNELETTSNLSSGVIGKGSFIHLDTPLVQRSWFFYPSGEVVLRLGMVLNFSISP